MTVIKTSRNRVITDEPEAGDAFVEVGWFCPMDDPKYLEKFKTEPVPIEEYQRMLDWAVGMADAIERPLFVQPLTFAEAFSPRRMERLERAVARLTDEERRELRQEAITACAEVMRDSNNPALRREAYDVLVMMGVVAT